MSLLGETTLTRRRYGAGSYVDGYWVDGVATTADIVASVQPMSGRDREVLEEGVRTRDGRKLYVADRTALQTAAQSSAEKADEVQVDGAWFTVVHVDTSHPLTDHVRAYAVRLPEGVA